MVFQCYIIPMIKKGLWISKVYPGKGKQAFNSMDIYWYDVAIGSVTQRYENAGWSAWKWCSGSAIGDRMKVENNNDFGTVKTQAIAEVWKQIEG